jgi:mannan endo-1,4-beta-mannosidase
MTPTPLRLLAASLAAAFLSPAFAVTDGSDATLPGTPSAAAQSVFTYLAKRVVKNTNKLVEGQHLGGINDLTMPGDTLPLTYFDMGIHGVADTTGALRYPGMVGARYDATSKRGTMPYPYVLRSDYDSAINVKLVSIWQQYHPIIALTATPPNPWEPSAGRSPNSATQTPSLNELRRNAPLGQTAAWHAFWDGPASVATIADGLEELKNQGVPVVLRPFAEFNIGKYYGPGSQQPGDFVGLWQDVHDYYVNTRHLNNLIFCWEAWVLNRNAAQSNLDPWFPGAAQADIVAGAYYFTQGQTYFDANHNLVLNASDQVTQNALIAVAEKYDKPFGAAQWGLEYNPGANCAAGGDDNDTLGFLNSVKGANGQPRTSFIYYWTDLCAVEAQSNKAAFVSNALVATADDVAQVVAFKSDVAGSPASPDGWVIGNAATPVTPEAGTQAQAATGTLRTGDTAQKQQYRSILTFNTTLPAGVTIQSASLRIKRNSLNAAVNPFPAFGPETVDIAAAAGFNGDLALTKEDFQVQAADTLNVATMSDPGADGSWSEGVLSASGLAKINAAGVTQLRIRFTLATNGNGNADYVNWYSGDASSAENDRPQLVITYTR